MRPRESSFPTNVTNPLLAPCSGLNPSGLPEESCLLSAISSFACAPPGDNVVLDENQGGDSKKKVSRCVCSVNIEPLYPYSNRVGAKPIRDAHRMQLSHGSLHCSTTAHLAKSVEHFGIGSQGDIMEVRVNPWMTAQGDNRWLWK